MNEITIKRTTQVIGAEIRSLTTQARTITLWYGIEIGRRLTEAKELCAHGEWMEFLKTETEFSQPTASRFMKLFGEYGADQGSLFGAESKYSTLNNLSVSNALRLLALPEEERESFAREHDAEHLTVKEMEELVRQRTEELEAREREALESVQKLRAENEDLKLRAALAQAQKELKASGKAVTVFGMHFNRAQEDLTALMQSLTAIMAEDPETAGKLMKAVAALTQRTMEQIETIGKEIKA